MFTTEIYLQGRVAQLETWITQRDSGSEFLIGHPAVGVNLDMELAEARTLLADCRERNRRETAQKTIPVTALDWINGILA